jgi:hypothetical protein
MKTGALSHWRDMPFGACFNVNVNAKTLEREDDYPVGADGLSICCITPRDAEEKSRGHWYIDSRANNCTLKTDDVHRCWIRHGTVGDNLTVDKAGHTCAAGAGSIQNAGWHGFLKNGILHT